MERVEQTGVCVVCVVCVVWCVCVWFIQQEEREKVCVCVCVCGVCLPRGSFTSTVLNNITAPKLSR